MTDKRFANLDILKGIAIILVIICHINFGDNKLIYYSTPLLIDMAVPMFMIISGYLFSCSYVNNNVASFIQAYDFRYVGRKILRFTIPFIVILFLELLCISTKNWNLKWFFVGGMGPGTYYYPVMIQLIFCFPLIYFLFKKHKNPFKALILIFIINFCFEFLQNVYGLSAETYRLLMFRYLFYIGFGVYFQIVSQKFNLKKWILPFFIGLLYIILNSFTPYEPKLIKYWRTTSFITALYFIPIFYLAFKGLENCRNKLLELIGKASWNIFLVQMFFFRFTAKYIVRVVDNIMLQAIIILACCLVAGIIFYFIETPITKFVIKKSDKYLKKINDFIFN